MRSVVWGPGGTWVEKRYDRRRWPWFGRRHDPWEIEWRIGSLLRRQPPPVPHARLLAADRRAGWLRFEAVAEGALAAEHAAHLREQALADPPEVVFGHGDITARNVVRSAVTGEAVLIDWEWAGRYPCGWDLAFVWFTLVDLPGGRARVEAAVPRGDEATRDELLERIWRQ